MSTTTEGLPLTPRPGAEGWTVQIDMPVFPGGRNVGKPVSWITTNDRPASKNGGLAEAKRRKLWRQKAYATYLLAKLPKDIGRIHVTFQYGFVNGTHPDLTNLGPTEKPLIDALLPYRTEIRKGKEVTHEGVGMIHNDKFPWVVHGPDQPLLPYLGHTSRIRGRVAITIIPL